MGLSKVTIRNIPKVEPPIGEGGGRIFGPAGELAQIVNGETFRFLAYIEFKPDATKLRGNHYHVRKTEFLYVIAGSLRAIYEDVETGERFETVLRTGDLVKILPGCAHSYVPLEYTQAIEVSPTEYDPSETVSHDLDSQGTASDLGD